MTRERTEMEKWELEMLRYMSIAQSQIAKQYKKDMTELEANLAKGTAKF